MTSLPTDQRIKIEKVAVQALKSGRGGNFQAFVLALRDLKKGESFLYPLASNDRMAIAIVQLLLERDFVTRKEGGMYRIGRVL